MNTEKVGAEQISREATRPSLRRRLVMLTVVAAVFAVLGSVIYKNWQQISTYEFHIRYPFLVISFVIFVAVFFMAAMGWGLVLRHLKSKLILRRVLSVWFLSQFTRWLPGNLWSVLSMFYLTQEVPKAQIALSGVLTLVFNFVGGVATVLIFAYWLPSGFMKSYPVVYILPAVVLIGLLFLYPALPGKVYDNKLSRYLLRKIGKERFVANLPEYGLGRRASFQVLLFYIIYWCLSGVAFYFFVISIFYIGVSALPACILIFVVSWIVSFLAFVAPGGLGVKESIMTLMLAHYLPLGVAAIISVALRIWMIIGELFCLLIVRFCLRTGVQEKSA